MSWFDKISGFAKDAYSLGKNAISGAHKVLGKVHHYSNQASKFLNSRGVKNLVGAVSHYTPEANDVYKDVKGISKNVHSFTGKVKNVFQPKSRHRELQEKTEKEFNTFPYEKNAKKSQSMERTKPKSVQGDYLGNDTSFGQIEPFNYGIANF